MEDWWNAVPEVMESMMDAFWGSDVTRSHAPQRMELSRGAYQELASLWNALNEAMQGAEGRQLSVEPESETGRAFRQFHDGMREVYERFDIGVNYARMGLLEKWTYTLGKQLHRNFASTDSQTKELQYEFEKLWDNFFSLVRRDDLPSKQVSMTARAKDYLTSITADRLRLGFEEEFLKQRSTPSSASYLGDSGMDTALGLLNQYELLASRKIGVQLSESECTQVARTVVEKIGPKVMTRLTELMNGLLTGTDLLKVSDGMAALVRIHFFYLFRTTVDALLGLDKDYRLLMELPAVNPYTDITDFMVMEAFTSEADVERLIPRMAAKLDPLQTSSATRREELRGVARRSGSVPTWGIESAYYRTRAATVFANRILLRVELYKLLSQHLSRGEVDVYALVMERLKALINVKEALYLQESFKGWAIARLVVNLGIEVTHEIHDIAHYSAAYIAADIGNDIRTHFREQLADEFLNGVEYFATYAAQYMGDPFPQTLLERMRQLIAEWWPWGKETEDGYVPSVLPLEEKLHIYSASRTAMNPISLGVQDLATRLQTLAQEMLTLDQWDANAAPDPSRTLDRKLIERIGVSHIDLFTEVGRALCFQLAIDMAQRWATHYEALAVQDLVMLGPFEVYATEADKRTFSESIVKFAIVTIHETVAKGGDHVMNASDFRTRMTEEQFRAQLTDAAQNFFYYQNIATNLELLFHQDAGFRPEAMDTLRKGLTEEIGRQLEMELPNALKRVSPDFQFLQQFNPGIDYGMDTFDGVMANFFRNVADVLTRRNLNMPA